MEVSAALAVPESGAAPALAMTFEQLVASHFDLAWRTLRRLGVEESGVDDAVQKVFLTVHEKRERVQPGRERAFVVGVCSGIAANTRRAQRRARSRSDELPEDLPAETGSQELALDQRRARGLLDDALAALEPELRLVFVLHELERMTGPEIAECAGVPLGTVASRLRRARAVVMEQLADIRRRFGGEP
jgi:RNA polymerase sigma-70 factor (ECF subfamily)